MVGSVQNLVNEVLQSAVGNYFRNKIQSMAATEFIQQRDRVQEEAFLYIKKNLDKYEVETLGVFLQDIKFPEELSVVLREREIATQEAETYQQQRKAQDQRIETEQARGRADQQGDLAKSEVNITIAQNLAEARKRQADGEAFYTKATGEGQGAAIRAIGTAEADAAKAKGLALAAGLEAQKLAVGEQATLLVNVIKAIADGKVKITPEILVSGGADGPSQGLLALVMGQLGGVITPGVSGKDNR
jgi:regulator of protease activity HflC (stomatin/prohibitin superfamily)